VDRIVGRFSEQAVCFPGDIALAAASMITGGIASRHPALRIAFSHGGGALPVLLPRLMHAWRNLPAAKQSLEESPEAIARRFFYDALLFDAKPLRLLLDTMGTDRIVLGSDYPFEMGDPAPVQSLRQAGLSAELIEAITNTNARRFLGER
jgi:aminocarboxymuconate-semialdehyde decarboxylase